MLKKKMVKILLSVAFCFICFFCIRQDSYAYYDTDGTVWIYGVSKDTNIWLDVCVDHMKPGTGNATSYYANTVVFTRNIVSGAVTLNNTTHANSTNNWIKSGATVYTANKTAVTNHGGSIKINRIDNGNGTYNISLTFENVDTLGATPYLRIDNSNNRPGYTVEWGKAEKNGTLTTSNSSGGTVQRNEDNRITDKRIYLGATSPFSSIRVDYKPITYTVNYKVNGVLVGKNTCTYDVPLDVRGFTPKTGYKFSSNVWCRNGNASLGTLTPGTQFKNLTTVNGENLTYMINQTPITYKIRYKKHFV